MPSKRIAEPVLKAASSGAGITGFAGSWNDLTASERWTRRGIYAQMAAADARRAHRLKKMWR
jgi:hypothetical protein